MTDMVGFVLIFMPECSIDVSLYKIQNVLMGGLF